MSSAVVLLVDDEVPFVRALSKRLSKMDFIVISAFSGEEALEVLAKKPKLQRRCRDLGSEYVRDGRYRHTKRGKKGGKK